MSCDNFDDQYLSATEIAHCFSEQTGIQMHPTNVGQAAKAMGLEYVSRPQQPPPGIRWVRPNRYYAITHMSAIFARMQAMAHERGLVSSVLPDFGDPGHLVNNVVVEPEEAADPEHAGSPALGLPPIPPRGLLVSMALRYDHGLFAPSSRRQVGWELRLQATLTLMQQLYEEVAGYGFYSPEKDDQYQALALDDSVVGDGEPF